MTLSPKKSTKTKPKVIFPLNEGIKASELISGIRPMTKSFKLAGIVQNQPKNNVNREITRNVHVISVVLNHCAAVHSCIAKFINERRQILEMYTFFRIEKRLIYRKVLIDISMLKPKKKYII